MKHTSRQSRSRSDHDNTRRPARQGRPNKAPARVPEPAEKPVKLAESIVSSWASTIIAFAKFSLQGIERPNDMTILKAIATRERGEIQQLWEAFTRQRDEIADLPLNNRQRVVAYMVGFHLANAARTTAALDRLDERQPNVLASMARYAGHLHISDLGCGSGAVSLTAMERLARLGRAADSTTVHLCDRNGLLLDVAGDAHARLEHGARVSRHRCGLDEYLGRVPVGAKTRGEQPLELFLAGYVWNELSRNARARRLTIDALRQRASKDVPAVFVVLDPANQDPSRETMELRDALVESGWKPLYPCAHDRPCPMLERARDWCYSEAAWSRPPFQTSVDQWLGVDRSRLASSMHILATPAALELLEATKAPCPTVVGRPANSDGSGFAHLVCGPNGLTSHPAGPHAKVIARGREWRPRTTKSEAHRS